jgi:predicted phosphodiesterase
VNVLALYDIHGNVDALDAVLADPRAADPDVVVVGGDTVPGAFAGEALGRLDSLSVPVHRVRGNGEREVAEVIGAPAPAPTIWSPERRRSPPPSSVTSGRDGSQSCH